MVIKQFTTAILFLSLVIASANALSSEAYPSKPVRILASQPGGAGDNAARWIGPDLARNLGQPVIVDNRSFGNVSIEVASKALPDGYTLLITGNQFLYSALLQKMNYDPLKDFEPLSLIGITPSILAVSPALEVNSVKDLVAMAKAKPGVLNYASGGAGGTSHLAGELFKALASVNIVRVPYKSGALAAVMAGEVQIAFDNPSSVLPLAKAGKLKALAVTSARPSVLIPTLPTVASSVPGFEMVTIAAAFVPAKTPEAIIKRLNEEMVRVLNIPEVKARFLNTGVEVVASSPEELSALDKAEISRMGKVIREAGIHIE